MTRFTQISCLFALAAVLGCGETQDVETTQLTFDRPVDIAFGCYGDLRITNGGIADPNQPVELTAMPTSACAIRSGQPVDLPEPCQTPPTPQQPNPPRKTEAPTPSGQEVFRDLSTSECRITSPPMDVNWYGLILQSGPGTVAFTYFDTKPIAGDDAVVADAAPLLPGKNSITVGEEPVAIHTDAAGCHAITANAGSCDLSVLDLNSALDSLNSVDSGEDSRARVDRIEVRNASGTPIRARPAAMVGEASEDLIGDRCPEKPRGLVYVAYPSCHLVAAVDTSTGTIVSGIQYNAAGVPTIVGGDVTCPDECGGGGGATPGVRPVTLDLELDPRSVTRRLAIGADNSASITMVELDVAWRPNTVSQIALESPMGNLGVTKLALSPEISMGGEAGDVDADGAGGLFQFVYAVATDGTVRVADVLDERRECDTQVDARFARSIGIVHELSCLESGTLTTPRRAGARSPGIHLPGDAIPLSVEIFRSDKLPTESKSDPAPGTLIGYFAAITASNGDVFIVNVDDDNYDDSFRSSAPLAVPVQLAMAHQLRDSVNNRHLTIDQEDAKYSTRTDESGMLVVEGASDDKNCAYGGPVDAAGPRVPSVPARAVPTNSVATEKLTQLPGFRQVLCDRRTYHGGDGDPAKDTEDLKAIPEVAYAAPNDVRYRVFPDLQALRAAETWSMVWEGSLSLNSGANDVDGPAVRESMLRVDSLGMHVLDDGKPFCDAGVEPFDILQLRGCDPAAGPRDCPSGYSCFVHPDSQIQGLGACMLTGEADRLASACRDYQTSLRRYTIKTASSGELLALPRRVELRTTPLDGCVDDAQCESLSTLAARSASATHPCGDGVCDLGRETAASCAADCNPASGRPVCGDSTCEDMKGETAVNCAADCDGQTWACVADPLRAPMGGTGKRCELRCDTTDDCLRGTICQGAVAGQPNSGFCMEGVIPPQACINASQRYELRAGEAFAVIGTQSGFVHPIIADANGQCVRDPMESRLSIGRLPLLPKDRAAPDTLQMCDPTADPITGRRSDGSFDPNPCLTTVPHTEVGITYVTEENNICKVGGSELVERQAPAVQFRNRGMTLTIVDPYYPGDARCITDRQGNRGLIPHVVPGTALTFQQAAGFVPMRVNGPAPSGAASFPVKVVRGPTNTVWVIDEGDFLSTSAGTASTRGKVLRFHPRSTAAVTVLQ